MKQLKVTLLKSPIGLTERQRANLIGLGLRAVHDQRTLINTPAVRGMIRRMIHVLRVEEVDVEPASAAKA